MEYQEKRKEIQQSGENENSGKERENSVNSEEYLSRRETKRGSEKFFDNRIAHESQNSAEPFKWLTTAEAAQYLRVSNSSIKTMIYRGQVRAHKLGRRNRFLAEELDRLIIIPSHR